MVTGVEATGIALAILPLLVNQLDGYVRGLERIKSLRGYRQEIRRYRTGLGGQYAILLNTLELLLEDIVDDDDERMELIRNPAGRGWQKPEFQQNLRHKLGRDYDIFIGATMDLSDSLERLAKKLGITATDKLSSEPIHFSGILEFRRIFFRAAYEDLLAKIEATSQILQTLTDQSHRREEVRGPKLRREGLKLYQTTRRHASALYNALDRCWKCSCTNQHSVYFQLDSKAIQYSTNRSNNTPSKMRFTLMLSSKDTGEGSHLDNKWHEIEAVEANLPELNLDMMDITPTLKKTSVHFADTPLETSKDFPEMELETRVTLPIYDLCTSLHALGSFSPQSGLIGYIFDEPNTSNRYNMRLLRILEQTIYLRSLHDILTTPNSVEPLRRLSPTSTELSRRDRLFLATLLACGVLQFHGTWLKQHWSIRDIKFAWDDEHKCIVIERPYLAWQVLERPCTSCRDASASHYTSQMRHPVLFPLALALIELSLGQPFSELPRPRYRSTRTSSGPQDAADFLTKVYCESGRNYGDAVKECLYWPPSKGGEFDDHKFQESVFETIIFPLLKDFNYFEGISSVV
ncbi:hypothetical protein BDW59DRAFT_143806 [Aspergillus cavernicola]|uniref:DUF7580 domain-containing protein n=1 Tax=Aspergillus cavernicola TaxID=176166 RepID=A0ABR4IJ18_9EURO